MRDAVIIGAGHNGLVAAAYLAGAGLDVEILERREIVGGACVTEELWPGVRASPGAYTLSLLRRGGDRGAGAGGPRSAGRLPAAAAGAGDRPRPRPPPPRSGGARARAVPVRAVPGRAAGGDVVEPRAHACPARRRLVARRRRR